jgi:hypothetical protein
MIRGLVRVQSEAPKVFFRGEDIYGGKTIVRIPVLTWLLWKEIMRVITNTLW